ncbi:hypothetical protein BH11VER1_BH11VER1_35950 [soil metagenome]
MSSVAFCTPALKVLTVKKSSSMTLGFLLLLTGMFPMQAQDIPPPPPERADRPDKPLGDRPPGDRPRWSEGSRPGMPGMPPGGSSGMRHGDKDRMDAFQQLTEEERQKVRAAFEKVWNNPEITAARERLTKANDEYRAIFHKALQDADPEVAKILSKIKPPEGGPMMGKPDLNEPDFPQKAPQRLAFELQMMARAKNQNIPVMQLHEKFLKLPAVQDALQKLREADVNGREEAWRKVRDAYQSAVRLEMGGDHKVGDAPKPPDPNR